MKKTIVTIIMLFFVCSIVSCSKSDPKNVQPESKPMPKNTIISGSKVNIETSQGTFVIQLNKEAAPKTVENFLQYVQDGFYDNTIFHRVIKNFMIQGGGLTADMKKKSTRASVDNEADNGLENNIGTIAMARTGDPNSATAQFFINTKDNHFLNHKGKNRQGWGYCVFGKVVEGMDVVRKIEGVQTGTTSGRPDVPASPVTITKASVLSEKEKPE